MSILACLRNQFSSVLANGVPDLRPLTRTRRPSIKSTLLVPALRAMSSTTTFVGIPRKRIESDSSCRALRTNRRHATRSICSTSQRPLALRKAATSSSLRADGRTISTPETPTFTLSLPAFGAVRTGYSTLRPSIRMVASGAVIALVLVARREFLDRQREERRRRVIGVKGETGVGGIP